MTRLPYSRNINRNGARIASFEELKKAQKELWQADDEHSSSQLHGHSIAVIFDASVFIASEKKDSNECIK